MIDHIQINVSSFDRSCRFYAKALAPLGYKTKYNDPKSKTAGFGAGDSIDLWITEKAAVTRVHIAMRSPDRAAVDQFHANPLAAGGRDNGAAGLRPDYSLPYYAAFVLDPDGNNLELVCHEAG